MPLGKGQESYAYRFESCPDYKLKNKTMITISTLIILLYAYIIYKIRIDSGSWKQFDPYYSNLLVHIVFIFTTSALIVGFMGGVCYVIENNIVP